MNPYERRVIHSVLQNDRYVETHSEGEEPYRKVVITLKKDYRERSPRSGYNREGRYNRENNYNRERGYRRERSYSREEVERPAENNEHNVSNDNVGCRQHAGGVLECINLAYDQGAVASVRRVFYLMEYEARDAAAFLCRQEFGWNFL